MIFTIWPVRLWPRLLTVTDGLVNDQKDVFAKSIFRNRISGY
ncbi:hypothetical protein [Fulvitalea axinellae]